MTEIELHLPCSRAGPLDGGPHRASTRPHADLKTETDGCASLVFASRTQMVFTTGTQRPRSGPRARPSHASGEPLWGALTPGSPQSGPRISHIRGGGVFSKQRKYVPIHGVQILILQFSINCYLSTTSDSLIRMIISCPIHREFESASSFDDQVVAHSPQY